MENIFIGFKSKFIYKTEIFFTIIASIIEILVQMALWKYLYHNDAEMIKYMMGYVVFSNIIRIIYSNRIYYVLSDKIESGDFALDLIKPINIVWFSYLKSLGEVLAQIMLQALPLILVFLPIINSIMAWGNLVLCLLSFIAGHILYTLIYAIIGFSSFVFIESWALRRLLDDTINFISGALLPIVLFPAPLKKIALVLPFHYLFDFPLKLLLNTDTDIKYIINGFMGVSVWIIGLGTLLILVYRLSIRACVVQGG